MLLRLVGVMNLMLAFDLFYLIFKGENLTYAISLEKLIAFIMGLYSNMYRPISLKLGVMIETTKFYILISVWMTVTVIQGHSCVWGDGDVVSIYCTFKYQF